MIWLWAALLTIVNLLCLLLVVLGLPGTWLMVALTMLLAWWTHDAADPMFGLAVLVTITALAIIGELLEFALGAWGARRAGGTKRGSWGALLGSIVGGIAATFLIPMPIVGTLVGACVGAAAGAWAFELHGGLQMNKAVLSGVGAGVGRLAGTLAKIAVGLAIWLLITIAAFWN